MSTLSRFSRWGGWLTVTGALVMATPAISVTTQRSAPQTMKNLVAAVQGEANAAHRYELFARQADKEGYPQVAKLFRAAAESETIHRQNHQTVILSMGGQSVNVRLQPVQVRSTRENLKVPIAGESQEETEMYPRYIKQALQENVPEAAQSFTFAKNSEAQHEKLFKSALANLGHNPKENYYVSKYTGETYAVPSGHSMAGVKSGEFELIK